MAEFRIIRERSDVADSLSNGCCGNCIHVRSGRLWQPEYRRHRSLHAGVSDGTFLPR